MAQQNMNIKDDPEYRNTCIQLEDVQFIIEQLNIELQRGSPWRKRNMHCFKNPYSTRCYYRKKAEKLQAKIDWMEGK